MFLKRMVVDGKAYYALAESYRDEANHIQTRYIRRLGKLSDMEAEWWRIILQAPVHDMPKSFVNLDSFACLRSFSHGVSALVHSLYSGLGFRRIVYGALSRIHNRSLISKLIEVMVANRLDDPCSKLRLLEWLPRTSLPFILDLPHSLDEGEVELNENSFYRTMDALWKRRDAIERRVYEEIVKPFSKGTVLAKDLTSTYFEGTKSPLAEYGYSREHRPDLKQVCWSLIETEEGYPITLEVYPGNVADKSTVKESIARLKRIFGITGGIFVIDRGMATEENIVLIASEGFRHVVAERIVEVRDLVDEALGKGLEEWLVEEEHRHYDDTQLKLLGGGVTTIIASTRNVLKGRELERNGERFIVIHSSVKERDDLENLERKLAKGREIIASVESYASSHPNVSGARVIAMLARKLERRGLSTYFSIEGCEGGKLRFSQRDKVRRERKYAGIWVLRTDVRDRPVLEMVRMYKGLWILEHTFREVKSSLDLRPMWHRKPERIKAHIWICTMAYLMERIAEEKQRMATTTMTTLAHDQERVATAQSLFNRFRNVVLNEQGFRDGEGRIEKKWWATTELDQRQLALIKALGVEKNAFKLCRTLLG